MYEKATEEDNRNVYNKSLALLRYLHYKGTFARKAAKYFKFCEKESNSVERRTKVKSKSFANILQLCSDTVQGRHQELVLFIVSSRRNITFFSKSMDFPKRQTAHSLGNSLQHTYFSSFLFWRFPEIRKGLWAWILANAWHGEGKCDAGQVFRKQFWECNFSAFAD